jgi:tripartite-type tricarboxylate transporter receptor subunit TctC
MSHPIPRCFAMKANVSATDLCRRAFPGLLRGLAVTSKTRSQALPTLPTTTELGRSRLKVPDHRRLGPWD